MKNFLKIFLVLIMACTMQCRAFAAQIKFVQVTDIHFGSDESGYRAKVLENTVKSINELKGISFVALTGDNIDKADPEELTKFMEIVSGLNVPYYIVIGNHDVFKNNGLSKERYIEIIRRTNPFYFHTKPNYVFKKNGFVFIVVDGAKEVIPGPNGYFKDSTLTWLDKQLTKHKDSPVIILQHFPVVEPRKVKSHKLVYPEKYFAVLDKHENVIAVISGHFHVNHEEMRNGVYHISSPTLLKVPHYYKIIDIVTTKDFSPMVYTQLREVED